ncbi:MAG TPA: FN3 associated domain-containing protein, partial [Flavitalea sp.]|nr:FN3 associated domain-containing protein [Flavitalea sp.]
LKHYVQGVTIRYTLDGTEPDSLNSPKYDGKVILDRNLVMKAKAFKPGWITSETVTKNFYKSGLKVDSIALVTAPDPGYKADGPKTLINAEKGELSYRNIKWLAYHGKPMEAMMYFKTPQEVSSVTISSMIDISGYIMPAASIEVWGADKSGAMKLLKKTSPPQPTMTKPGFIEGLDVKFDKATVSTLKLVVRPVTKLPSWHPGKGEPGWIFMDEVFVN